MAERSSRRPRVRERVSGVERAFDRAAERATSALGTRGVPVRARVGEPVKGGRFLLREFEDALFELAIEIGVDSRGEAVLIELGPAPYPGADVQLDGDPTSLRRIALEEARR